MHLKYVIYRNRLLAIARITLHQIIIVYNFGMFKIVAVEHICIIGTYQSLSESFSYKFFSKRAVGLTEGEARLANA